MTIDVDLIGDGRMIKVDDRTAELGGSFYYSPLRPYSPLPLKWCYDQLIRYPKCTLIDVGSSTGCYALLSAIHPDLTVYAFEPVPLTCEVLRTNVALNNLQDKVTVSQCAVSDYNGKGIMNVVIADGGKGVSILGGRPAFHKVTEPVEVDVVTIDTYCALHDIVPTVIKCDAEGLDKHVLIGAAETIQRYHPFILTEYSSENAEQFDGGISDIIVMLENWGYVWSNPEQTDLWCVHKNWETEIK